MTREEAIKLLEHISIAYTPTDAYGDYDDPEPYEQALDMAIEALSADRPTGSDLISRQWLLDLYGDYIGDNGDPKYHVPLEVVRQNIIDAPSAEAVQKWIPCSERLPSELEAVTVTWVNHNPPVYYQYIKDVPKADTAVYYSNEWYWWDATVIDFLGEYGDAYIHGIEPINKDIVEIIAWMPLPEPYKGGENE